MAFACRPDYCAHPGAVFGSDSCCLRPGFQFSLLVAVRLAAAGVTVEHIAARASAASRRGGIRSGLASATVRTEESGPTRTSVGVGHARRIRVIRILS